jgi:hypothetical protein
MNAFKDRFYLKTVLNAQKPSSIGQKRSWSVHERLGTLDAYERSSGTKSGKRSRSHFKIERLTVNKNVHLR